MSEVCPAPPVELPAPRDGQSLLFDGAIVRIYARAGSYATTWSAFRYFGPTGSRFDPHLPPPGIGGRGVMYGGVSRVGQQLGADPLTTALGEVFQTSRTIDRYRDEPWVAIWHPTRRLRLLDLASTWTVRAGGNQALCAGDRRTARLWAQQLYAQLPGIDGLVWHSSVTGAGTAVAIFDHAGDAVAEHPDTNEPLSAPFLSGALERSADAIGFRLL